MREVLFSDRHKSASMPKPPAPIYDDMPNKLRSQVAQIASAAIGPAAVGAPSWIRAPEVRPSSMFWQSIRDTLRMEYGEEDLFPHAGDAQDEVLEFFRTTGSGLQSLDVAEMLCRTIVAVGRMPGLDTGYYQITKSSSEAIQEINERFLQNNCGYRFSGTQLVRIDSAPLDTEVVSQAEQLLSIPGFEGPNQEFDRALALHREGKSEDGILYALKALESTIKAIGKQRGWPGCDKMTASKLIDIVFTSGLLPTELQAHFKAMRATLESGAPTVRNNFGGHGQGAEVRTVASHMVAYAIHIAGAAIVLIANAHAANPDGAAPKPRATDGEPSSV